MKLLEKENLQDLFYKFMQGEKDVYRLIVDKSGPFSTADQEHLNNFFQMCKDNRHLFHKNYAPTDVHAGQESFSHIISKDYDSDVVRHRLYFNLDVQDRLSFVTRYITLCSEKGESFYIKMLKNNERKDNTLIYLSDEQLPQCKAMLNAIEGEMPWLKEKNDLPLSVEECGWYGYGVEDVNDSGHSYNGRVSIAVTNGFAQTLNAYRHLISVATSLAEFGSGLYDICRARRGLEIYKKTRNKHLYNEYMLSSDEYIREEFLNRSMKMALDFFGDKGFCCSGSNKGTIECLKNNRSILDISNSATGNKLSITPLDVLSIISDGKHCKLNFSSETERECFMGSLWGNVMSNMTLEGLLGVRVPNILKDNNVMNM